MIDQNLVFKIIVIGQQGIGKSSMLMRYIKNEFSEQYNVTVGVEFASKEVRVNNRQQVKLQIWDTAGQQAFRAIVRSFYKGIAGVFLCFGIDNQQSLRAVKSWYKQVRQNGHQEIMFFLVGTRLDLQSSRKITAQQANQVLKQIGGFFYIETSAKANINIEQLFEKSASIMHKKFISNTTFRQLVRPTIGLIQNIDRRQSFSLNKSSYNTRMAIQQSKGCCK